MTQISCDGKTASDCYNCCAYSSSHSPHYSSVYKAYISEVTCSIGGCRTFNEEGKRIN